MNDLDYQTMLTDLRDVVQECGVMIRGAFYTQEPNHAISGKASIDEALERKLHDTFTKMTPTFGFVSEECPELIRAPEDEQAHYWLLDPNDGTKPFQEGYRGPSISIALIRGDRPVLGIVYAYAARCGLGDLYEWAEGAPLRRNGLYVQWQRAHPVALVSNTAEFTHQQYQDYFKPLRYQPAPGIAYRLALVAAGQGTIAVSLGGPRDLDIAGGHALLLGAGLDLYDINGAPIRYDYHRDRPKTQVIGGRLQDCEPHFSRLFRPSPRAVNEPSWRVSPDPRYLCDRPDQLDRLSGAFIGSLLADLVATDPKLFDGIEATVWADTLGNLGEIGSALIENMLALINAETLQALPHPGDGLCSALPRLLSMKSGDRSDWIDAQKDEMHHFCRWLAQHLFPQDYPPLESEIFDALEASANGAVSFIDGLNLAAKAGVNDRKFLWLGAILGARFGRNALPEFLVTALTSRRPDVEDDRTYLTQPDVLIERIISSEHNDG
jgi:fructose-1,6-bisphosphatase/inositol monophosphatase family enzyme